MARRVRTAEQTGQQTADRPVDVAGDPAAGGQTGGSDAPPAVATVPADDAAAPLPPPPAAPPAAGIELPDGVEPLKDRDQAAAVLKTIAGLKAEIEGVKLDAQRRKLEAENDAAARLEELLASVRGAELRLEEWATRNRATLTNNGKKKTITLAEGTIGWRTAKPQVLVTDEERALEHMRAEGLELFTVVTTEVDSGLLGKRLDIARAIPGVTVTPTGERFYAAPLGAGPVAEAGAPG